MASSISAGTTSSTALVATADTTGALVLQTNNGTTALTLSTAQNATFAGAITANTIGSASATALTLQSAGTTAVTVDTSQNVGIGTASPTNRLQLSSTGNPGIVFDGTNQGADLKRIRIVTQIAAAGDFAIQSMNDAGSVKSTNLYIDSSGNVVAGSTTGYAKITAANNTGYCFATNSIGNGAEHIVFTVNGSPTGSITRVGGTGVAYNVTSDQRLKENIQDADSASALVAALQVRKFDWKADKSHQKFGFVAQELLTIAPEAVHQPSDTEEMMGVDYSKLVPMLVKAIQELTAKVIALETQVGASA